MAWIWNELPYVKLREGARSPSRATEHSAGLDLHYSPSPHFDTSNLMPGFVHKLGTGIAVEIPPGHFGFCRLRSGWATRNSAVMVSSGIIDSDYRGELIVPVRFLDQVVLMDDGDKFAQLIILPYLDTRPVLRQTLSPSTRGQGGFGSTDGSVGSTDGNVGSTDGSVGSTDASSRSTIAFAEEPPQIDLLSKDWPPKSPIQEFVDLFKMPAQEVRPKAHALGHRIGASLVEAIFEGLKNKEKP